MKKHLPYAIVSIVLVVFFSIIGYIVFQPGYIYHTDVTDSFYVTDLPDKYLLTYNDSTGDSLAEKSRIPIFYFTYTVFKGLSFIGLDDSYYVKTKIYLLVAFTLVSFVYFIQKFLQFIAKNSNIEGDWSSEKSKENTERIILFSSIIGAFYYVLNFWFTNRIMHFGLFFTTVTVPGFFYFLYTFLFDSSTNVKKLVYLVIFAMVFTGTPHTILFQAVLTAIIFATFLINKNFTAKQKLFKFVCIIGFWVLYTIANSYWILPYLNSYSAPDAVLSETIINLIGKYAGVENSIRLMGYWLTDPSAYFVGPFKPLQNLLALLPPIMITGIIAFLFKRQRGLSVLLAFMAVTGVLLSTSGAFTNSIYFYLMFRSPVKNFGWLFREYDKFGLLIAFTYSLGFSLAFYLIYKYQKKLLMVFIPLIAIVLLSNSGFFYSTLIKKYTPEKIPDDFFKVVEILKTDKEPANTLWYPGASKPFWASNEEVRFVFTNLISPIPTITTRSDMINYAEYLFKNENINAVNLGEALDLVGVKYLVLRNDELIFNSIRLSEALSGQSSMKLVYQGETLTIYENRDFTGLVKFYGQSIVTNTGLGILKDKNIPFAIHGRTFYNFTDKPSLFTAQNNLNYIKDYQYIDIAINEYENKFIYPFDYSTKKEDGIPGYWKIGSLENLNHAETDFFLSNLGFQIEQFDYGHGIVISREGLQKISDRDLFDKEYDITFSQHQNMTKKDSSWYYTSKPEDFIYYWNIVRSDTFDVENVKALEVRMRGNIDDDFIPHFKIYTYDKDYKLLGTSFLYLDFKNNVSSVIKIPKDAKFADFSVWTISTSGSSYNYDLRNLSIKDISNNVKPSELSFDTRSRCEGDCKLYARVLKSNLGKEISVRVNGQEFLINSEEPGIVEGENVFYPDARFKWLEVSDIKLDPVNKVNMRIINNEGFNSINAFVFLSTEEVSKLNSKITEIEGDFPAYSPLYQRPYISIKEINPTKYEVKIEGSRNQKGVIAFAKPYSKNWKLIGSRSESDIVNGYIPGWQIENLKDGTYIIEHNPQKYFAYGSIVSIMILAELIIYLTFDKVVRDSARKSNSQG